MAVNTLISCRKTEVGITILLHVTTTPLHKKVVSTHEPNMSPATLHVQELIVRVTDESDPFFLFNLSLGEADFQGCVPTQ